MLAVEVEVDVGEVRGWTAVDDHLVEDEEAGRSFRGFARRLILAEDDATQTTPKGKRSVACNVPGISVYKRP